MPPTHSVTVASLRGFFPARPPTTRAPKWRALAVALGSALAAALIVVPAAPAQAASNTTCTGTSRVTYSPGLTFTRHTTTGTEPTS
jgi:hypothetical protein